MEFLVSAIVVPGAIPGSEPGEHVFLLKMQDQGGHKLLSPSPLNTVRQADIFRGDFHLKTIGE